MQRIWMTGATGVVGSEILRAFLAAGHEVTALARSTSFVVPPSRTVTLDLTSAESIDMLDMTGIEVLVHNAAAILTSGNPEEEELLHQINVQATERLFARAAQFGVRKIIFTGSLSVLAKPLPTVVTESAEAHPMLSYSISKWKGEQALYATEGPSQRIVLRLSSPIGMYLKEMAPTVLKKWIMAAMNGHSVTIYGSGQRTQDFVDVRDVASAFVLSAESETANGVYHIGSGQPVSMSNLAAHIATLCSVSREFIGTDPLDAERWNVSIQRAKTELGYSPQFAPLNAVTRLIETSRK